METFSVCQVKGCGETAISRGYCRLHYIQYWRQIQVRKNVGGERLRNRVKEALIRDHVEGTANRRLREVQRLEHLDRDTMDTILGELRAEPRVYF